METNTPTIAILDVPPKFVLEVAYGVKDPAELAEEYGYTPEEWGQLKAYPAFIKVVEARKSELIATGVTFRVKSAMMVEDLLPDIYNAAKEQGASFHTKLAAVNFLAKAAGLDSPKKDEEQSGNQFNISINLGGGNVVSVGVNAQKPPVKLLKEPDIDLSELETPEYTEIEDELSYDQTHYFTEFLPHPFPE